MVKAIKQFIIRQLKEPLGKNVEKDIEWVCNSMGFMGKRDQNNTALKIIKELIIQAKKGTGLTSEELAKKVSPTQAGVIYHLKKLMKSGLIVKLGSKYSLRMNSLLTTIEEIEKEITLSIENIKKIAKDIDTKSGIEHR